MFGGEGGWKINERSEEQKGLVIRVSGLRTYSDHRNQIFRDSENHCSGIADRMGMSISPNESSTNRHDF